MNFHEFIALALGFSVGCLWFTFLLWACSPFSERR